MTYLHHHDIPRGVNSAKLIKLGYTFVCASYNYHETTPEIFKTAAQNGLHPRSKVASLITASVLNLCPEHKAQAGPLPAR